MGYSYLQAACRHCQKRLLLRMFTSVLDGMHIAARESPGKWIQISVDTLIRQPTQNPMASARGSGMQIDPDDSIDNHWLPCHGTRPEVEDFASVHSTLPQAIPSVDTCHWWTDGMGCVHVFFSLISSGIWPGLGLLIIHLALLVPSSRWSSSPDFQFLFSQPCRVHLCQEGKAKDAGYR
jgi:hypothetical protein